MNKHFLFMILMVICVWSAIIFGVAEVVYSEELYSYEVYGQNKRSGLVVAGYLWEADKEGNLKGKIFDEMAVQDECNGTWVGHGVAQVGCENGHQYVVEVVE